MQFTRVKSIRSLGKRKTLDFEVDHQDHNFYAEGLVTSNSHALAYSFVGYFTAYFKKYYTTDFFRECLKMAKYSNSANGGPQAEIAKIVSELRFFGIEILQPDLAKSEIDFSSDEDGNIRYGLTAIRGIAEKKIDALKTFKESRSESPNKFEIFQSAKTSGLTIGDLSALIQAGTLESLDEINIGRCFLALEAQTWNVLTDREKRFALNYGEQFGYKLFDVLKFFVNEEKTDGKKRIIPDKRYETIKKKCEKFIKIYNLNKKHEEIANWFFERKLLGYSYSGSLYGAMENKIENLMDMALFKNEPDQTVCNYMGIVTDIYNGKSKSGKSMLRMSLADTESSMTVIFFGDSYDQWADKNRNEKGKIKLPKKDSIVLVSGQKKGDTIFVNKLFPMDEKIYLKIGELSRK